MDSLLIASDHAGFDLKSEILKGIDFKSLNFKIDDLGPSSKDSVDYPDYAHKLSERLLTSSEGSLGILICGSGQGMAMSANRHKGIRAAVCWSEEIARLARQHNNANVLCLAARAVDTNLNLKIIKAFFEASFEGGRHQTRVAKI